MRTRSSVVVSLLAAAALTAAAQTPATLRDLEKTGDEPPANAVRLDVYATADGHSVDDLKASDVEVFEDNAPQALTSFAHVDGAASSTPRLFVLFIDTYHLPLDVAGSLRVPLVKFIDRLAGPDDMVALMSPDMAPTDVTIRRKASVISDIMQDVATWARRGHSITGNDGRDDLYDQCYSSRRAVADEMIERRHEMLALDALDGLVSHLRRIGPGRKVVITVTDGWRIFTPNPSLGRDETRSRMPGIFGGVGGRGGRGFGRGGGGSGGGSGPQTRDEGKASSSQMAECETDRSMLAMLDDSIHLRRLVDDANRGTVSVYPVFASGVAPVQDSRDDSNRRGGRENERSRAADRSATLRELADNTDGVAVVDEKGLDPALTRIAADLGSYYVLSYTSTNTKLDGRFRAVSVRVSRPDVKIRTRRGYRGVTAEELGEGGTTRSGVGSPGLATVNTASTHETVRLRTATWLPSSTGSANLWIVGELDYRVRKELAWSAGATGDLVFLGADGREVASQPLDVRPANGRFMVRLPDAGATVTPGDYAVRVQLHPDADPGTTVTETARVEVPRNPSILGEAVIWRRGPSTGPQFMTTADPEFRRTERIRVEMPTSSPAMAVAHLVDRTGKDLPVPVQVSTRTDPAGFRWVVADLTLAPLGFGEYGIQVTVGTTKQVAAFAVVP